MKLYINKNINRSVRTSWIWLMGIIIVALFCVYTNAEDVGDDANNQDEVLGTSNRQNKQSAAARRLFDPHRTWMAFVKHSERASNRHRIRSGSGRKNNVLPNPTTTGAPGPVGPPGPPGPPGAQVTKEVLLAEFRDIVREAAEKRMQQILSEQCKDCSESSLQPEDTSGPYVPSLFNVDKVAIVPRVTNGFFARMSDIITIPRKSFAEINNFHVPIGEGSFKRGDGFNSQTGQYEVTQTGIYHININLHVWQKNGIHLKSRLGTAKNEQRHGTVHASLCINSLCNKNAALETVVTMNQMGEKQSLIITGYLELKKSQNVSVFIDNNTNLPLKVHTYSYFSMILVGI